MRAHTKEAERNMQGRLLHHLLWLGWTENRSEWPAILFVFLVGWLFLFLFVLFFSLPHNRQRYSWEARTVFSCSNKISDIEGQNCTGEINSTHIAHVYSFTIAYLLAWVSIACLLLFCHGCSWQCFNGKPLPYPWHLSKSYQYLHICRKITCAKTCNFSLWYVIRFLSYSTLNTLTLRKSRKTGNCLTQENIWVVVFNNLHA